MVCACNAYILEGEEEEEESTEEIYRGDKARTRERERGRSIERRMEGLRETKEERRRGARGYHPWIGCLPGQIKSFLVLLNAAAILSSLYSGYRRSTLFSLARSPTV